MSNIMPEIPPIGSGGNGGKLLKTVIRIVKGIWDFITGSAKGGGDTNSITDDSSLENIDKIVELFSGFKEQVHSRSVEIERNILDEISFYLDEIKQMLIDNQNLSEKYGIKVERIERKIDRIIPHMSGIIDFELSKRISLDNVKCKNIMKMIPGEKKEEELRTFLNESINQSIVVYCENLKDNLADIYEEVTDEIAGRVEAIQKSCEIQMKKIEEIDAENYTEQAVKLMSDSYYIIDACLIVDGIMAEA